MSDCIFCKIVKNEIPSKKVYEDEDIVAFYDVNPVTKIHILVIPKKHIASVTDLKKEDEAVIGKIYTVINQIAKEQGFDEDGFRIITNCGEHGGQEVMHLHFHILAGQKLGYKIAH